MNPYLEKADAWHDFHETFIPLVRDLIAAQVDPRYIVKIDDHVYIHDLPDEPRRFLGRSDVMVAERTETATVETGRQTIVAPTQARLPEVDIERVSYIEIRDRSHRQLVTAIELLSPTNRQPGANRDQYLAKRNEVLASLATLIEIDLLRGGEPMPLENARPSTYRIMVSRYTPRPQVDLWPLDLRDRLPVIPIPLKRPDPDARLDLQEALDRVYDSARYATYLYDTEPEPPLTAEDLTWARQYLPSAANR
jgi:hypothetical protein